VILLFCYVNALININRGLISGAPESFQTFITKTLGVSVEHQNFYLGLLASLYVASALVFSLVFGYLSVGRKPVPLIAWSLVSWLLAALVSALAYHASSYYLLALGRVLSGIGEASFQCLATPFVNRHAPHANRTLWLGLFVASVIMGGASGFVYGSGFASSSLTWAGGFYIEIVLMIPAIALIVFCIPDELGAIPDEPLGDRNLSAELVQDKDHRSRNGGVTKTFLTRWLNVLTVMPFPLVALGYSAYVFTNGGFGTFSPTILIGLGFFNSESEASLPFGVIVLGSGAGGTVLGGILLDRLVTRHHADTPLKRATIAINMLSGLITLAVVCGVVTVFSTSSKNACMALFALVYLIIASLGPAANVAAMDLFPESHQALAIAAICVVGYLFGDIPSPVLLGYLKDTWAPRCGTIEDSDGHSHLNPECHLDRAGLRKVLLFAVLWLLWAVVFWSAAKLALHRKNTKSKVVVESPTVAS
jgi:MFS transporter, Spinster family, sphingosine-1-phosphate transporter